MKISKLTIKNLFMTATLIFTVAACSNDEEDNNEISSDDLKPTLQQYVSAVVVKTYNLLANEALELSERCKTLQQQATQENVQAAAQKWIDARKYWEESEAFLYGPATSYSIDPHIDSWPLDQNQLQQLLANTVTMSQMSADYAGKYLGYGLLGFHALEYVLFRNGQARNVNEIPALELVYAAAVAEDLARQCVRLEAAWAGIANISNDKQQILEDCELEPDINYGEVFVNAGKSGNTVFRTQKAAITQILMGCSDIADEVANTKITDPVASGNVLDVESWYSWNSITDFADNIRGIDYAYNGERVENANILSVSSYLSKINPSLDGKIREAIKTAIREIENMPAPFRDHLTEAETNAAKTACQQLQELLDEAMDEINN
ncbi:MAG: peptidase M75 [Bacteroidales bacterium]|jgi:predicted lipoprotein|nr:peptidase M75 [Bacteroidales bacterium]